MHHGQYGYSVHYQRKNTAHLFHLIMTMLTVGLWGAFVWLPLVLIRSKRRKAVITHHYR